MTVNLTDCDSVSLVSCNCEQGTDGWPDCVDPNILAWLKAMAVGQVAALNHHVNGLCEPDRWI